VVTPRNDTPDDVVLEFIHSSVGVHNFPHYPKEPAANFVVQKLIELAGETVEIDVGPVNRSRFLQQHGGGRVVQIKMRSENSAKFRPHRLRHFGVKGRYMREQFCGRKLELTDRGRLHSCSTRAEKKVLRDPNIIWAISGRPGQCRQQRLEPARGITVFSRGIERQMAFAHVQGNWLTKAQHRLSEPMPNCRMP
jgi:hypothetical protein